VTRFREKADSRINILYSQIPEEFKLSRNILFYSLYFGDDLLLTFKNKEGELFKVEQEKVFDLGQDFLMLRIYKSLFENSKSRDKLACINDIKPWEVNTIKIRHEFIHQFNKVNDSKNLLDQYQYHKNLVKSIKIERFNRNKVLTMLVGLIYYNYGLAKCAKFVDEWIIKGKWTKGKIYTHKGLLEIYTERQLR